MIAGYGSISREVARQLAALGMRSVASSPTRMPAPTCRRVPEPATPTVRSLSGSSMMTGSSGGSGADVLVLTMPLTDASRGVIGREVLAALPPRAWLINVSRGALVDEPALLEALRAGRLAGAVLDVFGEEPLPADSPWWDAPNVIVTPHASGHTLRFFDSSSSGASGSRNRRAAARPGRPRARILGAGGGHERSAGTSHPTRPDSGRLPAKGTSASITGNGGPTTPAGPACPGSGSSCWSSGRCCSSSRPSPSSRRSDRSSSWRSAWRSSSSGRSIAAPARSTPARSSRPWPCRTCSTPQGSWRMV